MNWQIEQLETCASTQNEAAERARNGAPDGTVIVAKTMTGGKGQHDRAWNAPEGGWYASIVLRDIPNPRLLTLALGNAVADIMEVAGVEPQLKWVNDVLVGGKKIAGILVDAAYTGDEADYMVAGIGINLNGSTKEWPDGLDATATTLEQELGVDTCIEDTEAYLLDAIGGWIDKVRTGRDEEIIAAFRGRDALHGKRIQLNGIEGTAQGINDEGHLIVDGAPVIAGTVTIVG